MILTFEQSKAILEAPLLILHCKTTYYCQMTSSSTFITLGTLTTYDIVWRERGNRENCVANSFKIREYVRKIQQGRWSFLVAGCEKKWHGTHTHKPDGEWDKTAEGMMLDGRTSCISCHQCFGKRRIKKQRKWIEVNAFQRM